MKTLKTMAAIILLGLTTQAMAEYGMRYSSEYSSDSRPNPYADDFQQRRYMSGEGTMGGNGYMSGYSQSRQRQANDDNNPYSNPYNIKSISQPYGEWLNE